MIVAIETCEKQNLLDESGISVSENCGVVDGLITNISTAMKICLE